MLISIYKGLNSMEQRELLDVAANPIFRSILACELKEVEEDMLAVSPGGDTTKFMLDYANLQQKRNDLKELQELLSEVIETQTIKQGEER